MPHNQLLTKCRAHRRHFDSCPWPGLLSPHACVPSQVVRLLLSQSAPVFSNERTLTSDRSIWFLNPKTHAIVMPISMPVVVPVPVTVPMPMPMILLFVLFCFVFCSFFFWRLFFSFLLVENLCVQRKYAILNLYLIPPSSFLRSCAGSSRLVSFPRAYLEPSMCGSCHGHVDSRRGNHGSRIVAARCRLALEWRRRAIPEMCRRLKDAWECSTIVVGLDLGAHV